MNDIYEVMNETLSEDDFQNLLDSLQKREDSICVMRSIIGAIFLIKEDEFMYVLSTLVDHNRKFHHTIEKINKLSLVKNIVERVTGHARTVDLDELRSKLESRCRTADTKNEKSEETK